MLRLYRSSISTSRRLLDKRAFSDATTTTTTTDTATTDESSKVVTGSVSFYSRDNAYGFIAPDTPIPGADNIFVHRNDIKSAANLPEKTSISNPFLYKREKVRFVVSQYERNGKTLLKAAEVEFADGTQVPVYRENYIEHVIKHRMNPLGAAVYKAYEDETLDAETRSAKVKEAYELVKKSIEAAKLRVESVKAPVDK